MAARDPAFLEEEQKAFNDSLNSDPTEISDLQKLKNQAEEAEQEAKESLLTSEAAQAVISENPGQLGQALLDWFTKVHVDAKTSLTTATEAYDKASLNLYNANT